MANSAAWACHRTVAVVPSPSRPAKHRFDPVSAFALLLFAAMATGAFAIHRMPSWAGLLYLGASALCFALYAIDKSAAIDRRERLPESLLLWPGLAGGWPGAIVAQQMLRHKTAKRSFRLRFWLSVVANLALFAWFALPGLFGHGR